MTNLFDIPYLGRLLRLPWLWRLLRLAALAVVLVMAAYGWHRHAIPGVDARDPLMYTNLANYFFWVVWIMGVVFVALFFGRAWCAVCPVGWLNGLFTRIGLQRPVPGWLRNFIPVTLALIGLQLAVYFLAIHRYPDYTAALLALILLLAALCGLVFRKRAFCTLLCPAGAVFGLYARVAPFQLRVKSAATCGDCDSKSCVSGALRWKRLGTGPAVLYWRSRLADCPVDLVPATIEDSASCTLCLHCAQNCDHDNIRLGRRRWLADLGPRGLAPSESVFFLVLLGMLTANFSKVYVDLREAIFWLPQKTAVLLGWQAAGYYPLAALWIALGLPLLLVMPGYLVLRLGRVRLATAPEGPKMPEADDDGALSAGFWETVGRLALPFIPLVLAAHAILAVVKLNAKGAFLPFVLGDPSGVKSYLAMNVMKTVQPPGVLIPLDVLKWLVLAMIVGGYLLALAAGRRAAGRLYAESGLARRYFAASAVGLSLLAGLYGATVIRWLFIR
jgi:hypothetical protein